MPSAIDPEVKKQVIKQWLSGDSRDRIAADNDIGAGTVSNIINEWKRGIENSEYQSIRELAVFSKKQGLDFCELASRFRLYNYINKVAANEEQIESFIVNYMNGANSLPPEKIIDLTNQLFDIAKSESIPPAEIPGHINQKLGEKQRLEEKIQEAGAILQSKNADIETINEFIQLKEHLSKHDLSLEDPTRLLLLLQTIKQIGYEPEKIVARFSRIESLRQTEKGLKNNCKIFEERIGRCLEVLPLCEQIARLRIGIGELLAFHTAVCEKAEMYNLSMESASYRVIEDIQYYNKLGGMKKELSDLATKVFVMNQLSARQSNAVMALIKLLSHGVTEDQILSFGRGECGGDYNNAGNHSTIPQPQMSI
jgi:hypothetical protein